jgi:asparagine synthetase B (glutamine-hydrolysing)
LTWRDPRLAFQGHVLARSLNEKARKEAEREAQRAEVAERAAERAVQRAKKSEAQSLTKLARENELKKWAHGRVRDSEERLEAAMKKVKLGETRICSRLFLERWQTPRSSRLSSKTWPRRKKTFNYIFVI